MRKYLIPFFAILLMFLLNSCNSDKQEKHEKENLDLAVNDFDSTDLKTSELDNSKKDTSFYLKYIFVEGNEFSYRLTTLAYNESNLQTDSSIINSIDQKIIRIVNFNTLSVENDSIAELKCTVSSILFDATMNGEKHTYRSGSVLDSSDQIKYIEYEGLVDSPFHIRITKFGELLDVYKVDQLVDKYLNLSGLKDSVHAEEKAVFQDQIINGLLKPFITQIFRDVPSKKIEVESTWEKQLAAAQIMVFKIQNTNHYKVDNIEMLGDNRVAVINGSVTSLVEGETKVTNNGINYEFKQPETEASGKIYFNLDKGLIIKSKTRNRISLSYSMQMLTPQGEKKGKSTETMITNNVLELL